MLEIKNIIKNRSEIERSFSKRVSIEELKLGELINAYKEYTRAKSEFDKKRAEQRSYNDRMAKTDKGSEDFKRTVSELRELAEEVRDLEDQLQEKEKAYLELMNSLPNIPDKDVPEGGKDRSEVLRTVGKEPSFDFEVRDHITIGKLLGLLDFERAAKISGAHMPMYTGDGALLEWALISYFIKTHASDGYEFYLPPHLLNEESAYVAGQLPKFHNDVYWTTEGMCLLPTAETALINLHRDEILEEEGLPRKYFAYTPCYRKEAGSYRSSDRGLKRVHQFNKVEMFQYTTEDDSDTALEELVSRAEKLVEDLGLYYRVTKLAGEDISFAMAKTLDVEVWLPHDTAWSEVSSVSNARDFQSRRGNIRYRTKEGELKYLHTLNASGLATSRLMIAILETYQQKDGSVVVPEVLREYVGKDLIKPK